MTATAVRGHLTSCAENYAPDIGWTIDSLSPIMTRCAEDLLLGGLSLLKRQQAIRTVSFQQESIQWYLQTSCKSIPSRVHSHHGFGLNRDLNEDLIIYPPACEISTLMMIDLFHIDYLTGKDVAASK